VKRDVSYMQINIGLRMVSMSCEYDECCSESTSCG
jgi:hypothetical protein